MSVMSNDYKLVRSFVLQVVFLLTRNEYRVPLKEVNSSRRVICPKCLDSDLYPAYLLHISQMHEIVCHFMSCFIGM